MCFLKGILLNAFHPRKFTADSVSDYGQWMGQKQKEGSDGRHVVDVTVSTEQCS